MEDLINEMIEKGLIGIQKNSVLEARRQWIILAELQYTKVCTEPDKFTPWLRMYRRN